MKCAANAPTMAIAFPMVGTIIATARLEKNHISEVIMRRLFL